MSKGNSKLSGTNEASERTAMRSKEAQVQEEWKRPGGSTITARQLERWMYNAPMGSILTFKNADGEVTVTFYRTEENPGRDDWQRSVRVLSQGPASGTATQVTADAALDEMMHRRYGFRITRMKRG